MYINMMIESSAKVNLEGLGIGSLLRITLVCGAGAAGFEETKLTTTSDL